MTGYILLRNGFATFCRQDSHRSYAIGEGRDLEITGLHQQLAALLMLKAKMGCWSNLLH